MKPLEKSFWEETGEMVHLEGMLSKALLRMQAVVQADSFKVLLADYRVAVEKNLVRLTHAFRTFDLPLREKKNDTAMALLQKMQQITLRTGSGPVLDALLLAVCLKTIALKTLSYATIASWAEALTEERRGLTDTLRDLHQAEVQADSDFQRLMPECHAAAAAENVEISRKRGQGTKKPFHTAGDW